MMRAEPTMPSTGSIDVMTDEGLLNEYDLALEWQLAAFSVKQAEAWEGRAKVVRQEILKRMKAPSTKLHLT